MWTLSLNLNDPWGSLLQKKSSNEAPDLKNSYSGMLLVMFAYFVCLLFKLVRVIVISRLYSRNVRRKVQLCDMYV